MIIFQQDTHQLHNNHATVLIGTGKRFAISTFLTAPGSLLELSHCHLSLYER